MQRRLRGMRVATTLLVAIVVLDLIATTSSVPFFPPHYDGGASLSYDGIVVSSSFQESCVICCA